MRLSLTVALLAAPYASAGDTTYMKPIKSGGQSAALIWIQGALIPASEYTPLLRQIQEASDMSLWVGQPSFPLDTPEPPLLSYRIDDALQMMRKAGFNGTTLFFGAHSLGTVFLQTYCADAKNKCAGMVLTGGRLARTHYYPSFSYPVPTLTMGGSLDGLARVTSTVAEAFYQQVEVAALPSRFPVVVIEGMNHYQWASGSPSTLERQRDLHAEISLDEAHSRAASYVAAFLAGLAPPRRDHRDARDRHTLASAVAATADFAAPIIAAYKLEGSRHFNSPRQIGGAGEKECVKGGCPDASAWATRAQEIIGADLRPGWTTRATNEFVDCSSTPLTGEVFHLPTISNDTVSKTVSTTTFSQCKWDTLDGEDTGFVYTSASEIGTKMSSRQCLLIKGVGETNANFSVDDPQFCRMANEQAYAYALAQASSATKARYEKHGQPYTFGDDEPKAGGPLFLGAGISYKDEGDAGVRVSSPMQKTEIDYWKKHFGPIPRPSAIPDPGCFHYCKLLSPARAIEWIYVDGLRRHYSINATLASSSPPAKPPQREPATAAASSPCCETCTAPREKYYSVDVPHGFCGECCMNPAHFWIFKIFEANLTKNDDPHPCSGQFTPTGTHYTEYSSTVTHGVPPVTMTLDLYAPGPK